MDIKRLWQKGMKGVTNESFLNKNEVQETERKGWTE